ncbi:MAG: peroxiredoxin [Promethearchaeota archaeon]
MATKMLEVGELAPEIELEDQDGNLVSLASFRGRKVLVYFYPKANTPGCTTEAKNFQATLAEYERAGVQIVGISKDPVVAQKKFAEKHGLDFPLLSDRELVAARAFGALEGRRVKRRTWLLDENGKVEKVWKSVSAGKHNAQVCSYCGISPGIP